MTCRGWFCPLIWSRPFSEERKGESRFGEVALLKNYLLGSAHVGAGPGINLDDLTLLDEEGNLDDLAGLKGGGLHHIA